MESLLDYLSPEPSWENRYRFYHEKKHEEHLDDSEIPLYIRASYPEELFKRFAATYGEEKAFEICLNSNQRANTTVRVNRLKTDRETLYNKWKDHHPVALCTKAANGIIFKEKINFSALPEYLEGLFEVQDEGSQLLSELVQPKPGEQVLDYCSGAGGKTLAFAPQMQGKGQIYLHDVRSHILLEAKKRLKRAGIQNAQFLEDDSSILKKLKKKMDWVLVAVPCSGTGTMRRNPDGKWRFKDEMLNKLLGQQRQIFEKALSFLKANGKIVYATCSVLREENEDQIDHFCKTYNLVLDGEPLKILPGEEGMDGFFGAVMKTQERKSEV